MNWIETLFFGNTLAHSLMILALVVAFGILLGKIKIGGISFGITWILFVGIAFSHFGMTIDHEIAHFVKEFGLILFVYSVGMQVGPGFFASFKKGGVTLNGLAAMIVFLGCIVTYVIHLVTGTSLVTMIGVLYGAVTNTPGLGAAQQTFADANMGATDPTIALGYAVAYPLGVVGIIMSIVLVRFIFGVKLDAENKKANEADNQGGKSTAKYSVALHNDALVGKTVVELRNILEKDFVISRICRKDGKIEMPNGTTKLSKEDKLHIISDEGYKASVVTFFGEEITMSVQEWNEMDDQFITKTLIITKNHINGKTLGQLKVRSVFGVNVTRIIRAGIDLVASADLELQVGDNIVVVGGEKEVQSFAKAVGNSTVELRHPNLIGIFLGIAIGVFFGSIPFTFPGMPQAVKLGLAGGPLVVAILVSKFGYKFKVVTYTTQSANMMLREVGISLFLAAVGLGAGEGFVETIANGGYMWVLYGVIITMVPLLITATVGRLVCKLNYFTLMGLMAGSTTDPPALAYSNSVSPNNKQAVAYATVYPLTMFLRVLTAQILMIIAL